MLSNGTALLLIVPPVMLWAEYGLRRLGEMRPRAIREASLIMLSLLGVGLVAFGSGPAIARLPSTLLWVFPPLLWAAVRFGPLGASSALLCVAALSIGGAGWQLGPFVLGPEVDHVLSLHIFWIVTGLPIMLLAAVIREREDVVHALDEQRNQLAHITRVATVGGLSGALAHEMRQPLMAILANAQTGVRLLSNRSVDLPQMREILEDIVQQDNHAAAIIRRLRTFLKESEPQFESLAVEAVIGDALALSWSTVRLTSVQVQTQIPSGLPPVRGDPVQLLQVVVNLVVNGCESMSGVPEAERRLRLQAESSGEHHVRLSVTDSGRGLPAGSAERVFDPFFTTKDSGLGLGLTIGRSIVAAHGGRLWGENNPQRGATFHLLLRTESANGVAPADRDR
jgi:signal transduction histidine kinase